jgi:hypothetical protein
VYPRSGHVAPASRFEGWVDVFGSGFGFVHARLQLAREGLVEEGSLEFVEGGDLPLKDF